MLRRLQNVLRMKSILDRSFHYTPAARTDLRKTFARIRREQRLRSREAGQAARRVGNVAHLRRKAA